MYRAVGIFTCVFQPPEMVFQPCLEQEAATSFHSLVDGLLEDIFKLASLVPRVAKPKELSDYHTDVEEVRVMKCCLPVAVMTCLCR